MDRVRGALTRLTALPGWVTDGALALALAGVELSFLWLGAPTSAGPRDAAGPSVVAVGVILAGTLPLTVRRRAPLAVLAVVGIAAALAVPLGVPTQWYGLVVALYTVAAHCTRQWSLAAVTLTLLGTLAVIAAIHEPRFAPVNVLVFATAWLLGDRQRTRWAYTAELESRAAQLEEERGQRSRLAVAEERSRIARELNDVVAHSVSGMVVQAAAARRLLHGNPVLADEALSQVEASGRQSLVEMRRILGALRINGEGAEMGPQPGLDQLDDLVEQVREAGLPVMVTLEGEPRMLPSGIELSAYRIVQEALTNVLKHAGPATQASVHVTYDPGVVRLEVADDGRGAVPDSLSDARGHGLVSMRERVAVLGGSLQVGPRPGGGFLIRAVLPLGERAGDRVRGSMA